MPLGMPAAISLAVTEPRENVDSALALTASAEERCPPLDISVPFCQAVAEAFEILPFQLKKR
jgi:hypothetical protein